MQRFFILIVSCKEIVTTKKVITDQNQDQDQILNCKWGWSALNISLQTTNSNSDILQYHGVYYNCTSVQSNTSPQTSNGKILVLNQLLIHPK